MWNKLVTLEQYRKTLSELIKIEFQYALSEKIQSEDAFIKCINSLTEAYLFSSEYNEKITADNNNKWLNTVKNLYRIFTQNKDNYYPEMWKILEKDFEPRFGPQLIKSKKIIESSYCGFSYEYHLEYFKNNGPEFLTLHFRNYFAPDSPFKHQEELVQALLKLLKNAHQARPETSRVQCASWLNNLSPFLELFPEEWQNSTIECPIEGHTGCWGQFIDRTGNIHQRNLEYLLKNRSLKFMNQHCQCHIDDLKKHLQNFAR